MIQITKRFKTGRGDGLYSVSQTLRFSNPNMKWSVTNSRGFVGHMGCVGPVGL